MAEHTALAFPLHWPVQQPRTASNLRDNGAKFRLALTLDRARRGLQHEVRLLGGADLVLSSNVELRIDGWPRSGARMPTDPGVAVYFTRKKVPLVFACDRYKTVEANMRAIALHLDALRGMERWGVGTLDQAFAGYQALPETAGADPWWKVLGGEEPPITLEDLQADYREAARKAHPDTGGSQEAFVRVQRAYEEGRRALGGVA